MSGHIWLPVTRLTYTEVVLSVQSGTARVRSPDGPRLFRTLFRVQPERLSACEELGATHHGMTAGIRIKCLLTPNHPILLWSFSRPIIDRPECGAFEVLRWRSSAFVRLKLEYNSIHWCSANAITSTSAQASCSPCNYSDSSFTYSNSPWHLFAQKSPSLPVRMASPEMPLSNI